MHLASLVILALGVSAPEAEPPSYRDRVAVLAIVSPPEAASKSDIHRAVSRATRLRPTIELLSAEEMFVANRDGLDERVKDCGPDVGCMASRMRRFRARLGLIVVLDRTLSPGVLSLQLVDTDLAQLVGDSLDELGRSTSALELISERAGALLEQAGYVESGRLVVAVDPPAAQIVVQGGPNPDLGSANVFTLRPGRYVVTAHHPGYDSAESTVELTSGTHRQVELTLVEQTSVWESPWLWVGIGVAVAGGITAATIAATQPAPRVCFSFEGRECD